jgi:hypothetical protein
VTDEVVEIAGDVDASLVQALRHDAQTRVATAVARVDTRATVKRGDVADFTVDTDRLHVFDLDTGAAIR